jgi:hypothetical protein
VTPSPSPGPILIELVNQGGSDWFTTALPFITLVIGAGLTYLFTSLAEKRRNEREDAQRWHQDIRTITAEILGLSNQFKDHTLKTELLDSRAVMDKEDPAMSIARIWESTDIARALQLKNNELCLISSAAVGKQSVELVQSLLRGAKRDLDKDAQAAAASDVNEKQQLLMEAVRKELGLPEWRGVA